MGWAYLPDLPPDTKNTWRVCDGFHADRNGIYRTGFVAASYSDYGSGIAVHGKAYRTASGTIGILVTKPYNWQSVTAGNHYVYDGSAWNDRGGASNSATAVYGSEGIAQFGNITLIATTVGTSTIWSRDATGTSNFALVAASPVCSVLLITPLNIVVALNADYSFGASVAGSDAWYTSDVNDYTNWATGQSASGNLRQTPGVITAGVVFGNDVVAFKKRGVYRGQYVGLTGLKWKWDLIPGGESYGAWGPGCAVNAAGRIYFFGDNGFCSYDGSGFQKLDIGIGQTINATVSDPSNLTTNGNKAVKLVYDSRNRRICIFNFGDLVSGITRTVGYPQHFTYNIDSGQWGYQSQVTDVASSQAYSGVIDDAHELNSFDNGDWVYNSNIALIDSANTDIRILTTEFTSANTGTNYKPKMRTHRTGDRLSITNTIGVVPNWTTSDGAGTDLTGATVKTVTPYASDALIEAETAQTAQTMSTDQFRADFTKSTRWLSAEMQINCEACIDGVTWDNPKYAGKF